MDFTKEHVSQLSQQAGILLDEIEALKYSLTDISFDSKEEGERYSLIELVCLLDYAQETYYKPIIESLMKKDRPRASRLENYETTFVYEADSEKTHEELLNKVIKHRAALINFLSRLSPIDWDRSIYVNSTRKTIYDLVTEMTEFDKRQLKTIADRVMAAMKR